jgi:LysR family transcriptional activator of nhaA
VLVIGITVLNFNHVYYFHVAATEGSVKAAADRLGVTQPTVSEQIKMLERALGLTLFDRTGTGLRLTDAGRQAYEHTTAMFRAGELLVRTIGHITEKPAVSLRVGMSASTSRSIAADFLMPVLLMEDCHPVIVTGDALDLFRALKAHELDLVIADTQPVSSASRGLDMIPMHKPRLVAIAAADAVVRDDWSDQRLLAYRAASGYRWEVDAYLEEKRLKPHASAELDDAFLMLEAVARGKFIAFVPRSVARDAITAHRVKIIAELEPGRGEVFALYHRGDEVDLAKRAVDRLVQHAKTFT